MGWRIVMHEVEGKEVFIIWSSIVDAPITYGSTMKQIKNLWKQEFGRSGLENLESALKAGTKRIFTIQEASTVNRAGLNETHLTPAQIVDYYFVRKGKGKRPEGWDPSHCLHPDKCNPDKGKHGCICTCEGCKEAS